MRMAARAALGTPVIHEKQPPCQGYSLVCSFAHRLAGCQILMLSKRGTIGQSEAQITGGQGIKVMRPDCKE
jgi:hypothetical protein